MAWTSDLPRTREWPRTGDPAAGLAPVLPAPSVAVVPRIEPYLVEVVVPFPLGSADEAVALAARTVAELLAQPDLGAAVAQTPGTDEDSPRVATAAMVQAVARGVVAQAHAIVRDAIRDLLTTPGRLAGLLPTEPPPEDLVPWLDRGALTITGLNPPDAPSEPPPEPSPESQTTA